MYNLVNVSVSGTYVAMIFVEDDAVGCVLAHICKNSGLNGQAA